MIDQLKQQPKTFTKFVEWMEKERNFIFLTSLQFEGFIPFIPDRELISLLVEFCDSEGYVILLGFGSKWFWEIQDNNNAEEYTNRYETYNSRTEATKAGIKESFKLMEKEL